jgi:hypothetical protein
MFNKRPVENKKRYQNSSLVTSHAKYHLLFVYKYIYEYVVNSVASLVLPVTCNVLVPREYVPSQTKCSAQFWMSGKLHSRCEQQRVWSSCRCKSVCCRHCPGLSLFGTCPQTLSRLIECQVLWIYIKQLSSTYVQTSRHVMQVCSFPNAPKVF